MNISSTHFFFLPSFHVSALLSVLLLGCEEVCPVFNGGGKITKGLGHARNKGTKSAEWVVQYLFSSYSGKKKKEKKRKRKRKRKPPSVFFHGAYKLWTTMDTTYVSSELCTMVEDQVSVPSFGPPHALRERFIFRLSQWLVGYYYQILCYDHWNRIIVMTIDWLLLLLQKNCFQHPVSQ